MHEQTERNEREKKQLIPVIRTGWKATKKVINVKSEKKIGVYRGRRVM